MHITPLSTFVDSLGKAGVDLYLVPMADEFQGEYIPDYAARLPYLSGFTGSAGLGIFRADGKRHVLFVDGRYTLQAAAQVNAEQFEIINSGDVSPLEWLEAQGGGLKIGFDPWLMTQARLEESKKATAALGHEWRALTPNLVDAIWQDQPAPPAGKVALQPMEYAGQSYEEKRAPLLALMQKHKVDGILLTQPDGINWLLNIRGADVAFNPLLLAYMLLKADGSALLFTYPHALDAEVQEYLNAQRVTLVPIESVFGGKLTKDQFGAQVLTDPTSSAAGWYALAAKLGVTLTALEDPTLLPKAKKNAAELEGMRSAHLMDGLAVTRFLHWFDTEAQRGHYADELEVIARLEEFRRGDADYRGGSFATIAGAGSNGAIVHYRADETNNRRPRAGELFLLDSGGQYPSGTTDITRTFYVPSARSSVPAPAVREHFTRVLKGHIALGSAKFPVGTSGIQLDVLARHALWAAGLDYDHGTGHGVGAYLCVHEGPQRISKRGSAVPLSAGMILSNEPGYYLPGQYGIRIENLVAVVEVGRMADGKPMLGFETLTLVPIDTRLVDASMLSDHERNWLNHYHQRVFRAHVEKVEPGLRDWLAQVTRAI